MNSPILCSFCTQAFLPSDHHPCIDKIYTFLNSCSQKKFNDSSLFREVDNLVFQGGGMKGLCFLGVLQELMKENPDIYKNMKRVAGTSAGSLVALYLALGLNPDTDIADLLSRDFRKVLDEGLALKVRVQVKELLVITRTVYRNYLVRDIFIAALDLMDRLERHLKDESKSEQAISDINDLVKGVLSYCAYKFGPGADLFYRYVGKLVLDFIVKWIFDLLKSQTRLQSPVVTTVGPQLLKSDFGARMYGMAQDESCTETYIDKSRQTEPNKIPINSTFEKILEKACESSLQELMEESKKKSEETRHKESQRQRVKEEPSENIRSFQMTASGESREERHEEAFSETSELTEGLRDENVEFYKSQLFDSKIEISKKEELEEGILYSALGELVWFILISQRDATGLRRELGLFAGDKVKEELIQNVIEKKVKSLGLHYKEDLTFKELSEFKDGAGKPVFKPFYITAFNSATLKTDIFSFEHTPNVVVADAVRASISIPVFFTPVTIRENGVPKRIYYDHGEKSQEIYFMDGGVLDNYPIWMFDDMKYHFGSDPDWKIKQKLSLWNTRTLGFMILDKSRIDIYSQPYFDKELTKLKMVTPLPYQSNIGYVLTTLFNTYVGEIETSSFRRNGDDYRTVFIDNMGMRALSFNLTADDKERIIQSGKQAVQDYKKRFPNKVSDPNLEKHVQI